MLPFYQDDQILSPELYVFALGLAVSEVVVRLEYLQDTFGFLVVGQFPYGLLAFVLLPFWSFEVCAQFLWVVVDLKLEVGLVLHPLLVHLLRGLWNARRWV